MAMRRRETNAGIRYDVEWRMPDRFRRQKTFSSERAARGNSRQHWSRAPRPAKLWIPAEERPYFARYIGPGWHHAPTSALRCDAATKTTGDYVSSRALADGKSGRSTMTQSSPGSTT